MLKSERRRKLEENIVLMLFVSKGRIFRFFLKQRCSGSQGSITGLEVAKGYIRSCEIQLQLPGVTVVCWKISLNEEEG